MPKAHAFVEHYFVTTPGPSEYLSKEDPDEINEALTIQAELVKQDKKSYQHALGRLRSDDRQTLVVRLLTPYDGPYTPCTSSCSFCEKYKSILTEYNSRWEG